MWRHIWLLEDLFNFNDKTHLIIYNASAYRNEKDTEIQAILKFISIKQADSSFTNELKASVDKTKQLPGLGGLYMEFINEFDEYEYQAEQRGREKKAKEMLKVGKLSLEEISQYTGLSIEKIKELTKES